MVGLGSVYFFEMIIPTIGMCLPIKKRENYKRAIVFSILAVLFLEAFDYLIGKSPISVELIGGYQFLQLVYAASWCLYIWGTIVFFIYNYIECNIKEAFYIFALSYGAEHIFFCIRYLIVYWAGNTISEKNPFVYIPCLVGSFALSYCWFAKPTVYKDKYMIDAISASTSSVILFAIVWGLSIYYGNRGYGHIHSIYAIVCVLFILYSQRSQLIREKERDEFKQKEQIWEKTKLKYEISKESMAIVNQHYHDMKHQIMALSTMSDEEKRLAKLQDMESNMAAFDAVVRTGNEILDTVLTEKKISCQINGISMSCIIDGQQLAFMDELDIYTLFGNALDNSIEANLKIEQNEMRWISVQIQNKKGIVLVEIVNPYDGKIITDERELPLTSKVDKEGHGFGVQSIKAITEKYGGQMAIKTSNNKYLLRLIFQTKY